jgi:peptidyl-prolyl cis-trans isomerase A (cyclophilin A)
MTQPRRTLLALLAALPFAPKLALAQTAAPRVEMVTPKGTIVVEVYPDKAPLTAGYFLRMVSEHRYVKPAFYRVAPIKGAETTGFIQGGETAPTFTGLPPIKHESTDMTGLKHLDGTISMPRGARGTANGHFFICVGDAPFMDAGPEKPGEDTYGFAAFGKVVEGMDVVKAILALEPSPTAGKGPMKGQMLVPPLPITKLARVRG